MNETFEASLQEICERLASQKLPRWSELPDLELYMDQVLALVSRYLDGNLGDKGLTASMVNNYVKLGIMPAPVRKKYTRVHLAYLIVICLLKPVLPIPSIEQMIRRELETLSEDEFYDSFCALYEQTDAAVAETALAFSRTGNRLSLSSVFAPALRARAEQSLAAQQLSGGIIEN